MSFNLKVKCINTNYLNYNLTLNKVYNVHTIVCPGHTDCLVFLDNDVFMPYNNQTFQFITLD